MKDERKKELEDYRQKLVEHKLETQKEYQKIIFGLSGGALIVSLTFSDNIATLNGIFINFTLLIGWFLLLTTVLMQVYYYRKVTKDTTHLISKLEGILYNNTDENEFWEMYELKIKKLERLNITSISTMFGGLLFLCIFFSLNILLKTPANRVCSSNKVEKNERTYGTSPSINIDNNPIFINNNGISDTAILKKKRKYKPLKPCN